MLAILSPAKSLDYESPLATRKFSEPAFVADSEILINKLREFEPNEISSLMGISDNLAELNHRRYADWQPEFPKKCARPAILAFSGDVYLGLEGPTLSERDFTWAQKHVRILSGLHGLLRPLDRIRPYRLEMGTQLKTQRGKNLYQFWGDQVTDALNTAISEQADNVLINLASDEYYAVLQSERINARIIKVHFRDWKNGQYKFLSFFAKKARGSMARYMIDKRVKSLKALRGFDYDGYQLNSDLSNGDDWVFTRKQD
ncbi:MAG: peroxide stress protein YaaA [Pseudomonadales bacterium]|nr:peroxide stress protein YaaA [Pseudomonadales bacterium]